MTTLKIYFLNNYLKNNSNTCPNKLNYHKLNFKLKALSKY